MIRGEILLSNIKEILKNHKNTYKFILKLKRIIKFLFKSNNLIKLLKQKLNLINAIKTTIMNANTTGEIIINIKDESYETASFIKVYDLVIRGEVEIKSPKLDIIKYTNTTVFSSSDFILCEEGVVWEKFYMPQFMRITPHDEDLLKIENNQIFIKKPSEYKKVKIGYSLCGVHSKIWAHFLVQYLPKLYLISDLIKATNQEITIILPNYSDPQIRELVFNYISKFNNIDVLELKSGEVAVCDILYHISNTAYLSDHVGYISPADSIIPKFVTDSIKKNLIDENSYADKVKNEKKNKNEDKLYIARGGQRNIINSIEIEKYFVEKGYLVISPHKVTFSEKIRLFRNASIIAGPMSSGFSNTIFCKKGTKVLMFSNFQRIFEPYWGYFAKGFDIDITAVTGYDKCPNDPHSSYTVPLIKIKSACDELGI